MEIFKPGKIKKLCIHIIGNKTNGEGVKFSNSPIPFHNIESDLNIFFKGNFEFDRLYHFHFVSDVTLNPIYTFISSLFTEKDDSLFIDHTKNIGRYLYDKSIHPKIKGGEFYIAYFKDCILDGETVDAIGLFKSENKDTFLEVEQVNKSFEIESRKGININKLDKGCLIFNTQKENGYVLSIVDNINKGQQAQYWKDEFLNVKLLNNEYHQTTEFLGITKDFITQRLSEEIELNKADKIDFLNKSVNYFKENTVFEKEDFETKVFEDSSIIDSFQQYADKYKEENEVNFLDNFEISPQAVKKQTRKFKSVLKLDKNFHIYIHGNRNLIEQGIDDDGKKYYKIYYEEES